MTTFSTISSTCINFSLEKSCSHFLGTTYAELVKKHPYIDKVAFIANHAWRAFSMIAVTEKVPFSKMTNCAMMIGGSLLYRISAEGPCPRKYAIPSLLGAFSYMLAKEGNFSPLSVTPLVVYTFSGLYSAYYSMPVKCGEKNKENKPSSCCPPPPAKRKLDFNKTDSEVDSEKDNQKDSNRVVTQ